MDSQAVRWSCARCKVSTGRMDGKGTVLPDTWTRVDGLSYCLSCSRARAADAATDSVPEATSREDLVRLRRSALIAFEIDRTPMAPDRVIANACRTSSRTVAAVRDELDPRPSTIAAAAPRAV